MSQTACRFITDWVIENINPTAYAPPGDLSWARELAELCLSDANEEGLSVRDLDAAAREMVGGSLVQLIAYEMDKATDAEVRRLVEKDG